MVRVVKQEPHPSVVKETICRNCGVTLEYVPADVRTRVETDYGGGRENVYYIQCPSCSDEVKVRQW